MKVEEFISKWSGSSGSERANCQPFLLDFCDTLGVEKPSPATGDKFAFEKKAVLKKEKGATVGRIDLYKEGCFILEAKQAGGADSKKVGLVKRGTSQWAITMRDAFGQAVQYADTVDEPPPFILTTDIGYCFDLYSSFDGMGLYRAFPNAQKNRVFLKDLPDHVDTFRAIFTDPLVLDPSTKSTKVTREVAAHLAELARSLEEAKHPPERVAKFLMRCIFTMFAEDVGMLPEKLFTKLLEQQWLVKPSAFPKGVQTLWKAMNDGSDFITGKLLRFNGGLFKDPDALPLKAEQLLLLQEAASCNWSEVEPAIFGTLLERALDPRERHRLGAHFTPRAYVERLVRPTIEEPLRADWDLVRAEVRQLVAAGKNAPAKKAVLAFYDKLCHVRVLDPACGTGNFLYVTLDIFKRLEAEVVGLLSELEEAQVRGETVGYGVTPRQFLGIEVKPWAKEIAELVLWIGYLQWHFRTRGRVAPPEPVLQDFGNIECRDAVLAWDREEILRDAKGRVVTRWDGVTTKKSPVTGEEIPDESATIPIKIFENARQAEWPQADFIVGNPPFSGTKKMRATLGDGYVDALREVYSKGVEDNADYVLYWWHKAATLVERNAVRRFGLITTNSITQTFNRRVLAEHLANGTRIAWAIPNHPWEVGDEAGAAVRIAMTVGAHDEGLCILEKIVREEPSKEPGEPSTLEFSVTVAPAIHEDLSVGADKAGALPLQSNLGFTGFGVALHGAGFILDAPTADSMRKGGEPGTIRRYLGGRDLQRVPRELYVIDFFGKTEAQARTANPKAFQHALDYVYPERKHNRRDSIRKLWWRFGWERPELRKVLKGLPRYIATTETATHRVFQFLPAEVLPDHMIVVIGSADAYVLGVLSSRIHLTWALAAGGRLGVGNDPRYNKSRCFDPFPFPVHSPKVQASIEALGEAIDTHRKARQKEFPTLTITNIYNVLEKVRCGETLSAKDKVIHDQGLVSILKQLHDDLDAAAFDAYGWPHDLTDEQILERLVTLNAERAKEEARGLVRWLRPAYQNPSGVKVAEVQGTLDVGVQAAPEAAPGAEAWPKKHPDRVAAVRRLMAKGGSWTAPEMAANFKGAKLADVVEVLASLGALGLAIAYEAEGVRRWRPAGRQAA